MMNRNYFKVGDAVCFVAGVTAVIGTVVKVNKFTYDIKVESNSTEYEAIWTKTRKYGFVGKLLEEDNV